MTHSTSVNPAERWRSRAIPLLPLLAGMLALAALLPARVEAHAYLDRTEPQANAVVPEPPDTFSLWFIEPLEPKYARAELYDANGTRIDTPPSEVVEPLRMVLQLPDNLPNGTYTVQWRNVSTADGHPQQGYVPFTIGAQSDVVTPQAPKETSFSAPPAWLAATGRWLSFLGLTTAAGATVAWFWVLRPARDPLDDAYYDRIQTRVARLILIAVGVGIIGSIVALSVQAAGAGQGYGPGAMIDVLTGTRYGNLWIARVVLMLGLAALTASGVLWDEPPSLTTVTLALGLAAGAMLPFSLNSHAAAQQIGQAAAVAADWLHLAATSVWIGGVLTLLVVLVSGTRGAPRDQRREAYALAIPRFTTLAISSVIILALTGLYAAWLQVGNLIALTETSYGQTLLVKLALLVPLLILGGLNMRVIGPRMLTAARSGVHFGRTIAAEAVLGVGILVAVGLLTSLPAARTTIAQQAQSTTIQFVRDDVHVALYISPGSAGVNRYTADAAIGDVTAPSDVQLLLRFSKQGDVEGVREVQLVYQAGNRFEATGSELSVTGDWNLELIIRRAAQADVRFQKAVTIRRTPPADRVPSQPPQFLGAASAAAILFGGLAIVAIVMSLRTAGVWQDRVIGSGIGSALLVAGGLILAVNRNDPTPTAMVANPIPLSTQSVAAGRDVFQQNCTTCHGPNGAGDGPAAAQLKRQPANLTEAHVGVHPDGDLNWWISNGIDPAMPSFGDVLSPDEIWNVINYVRSLSGSASGN